MYKSDKNLFDFELSDTEKDYPLLTNNPVEETFNDMESERDSITYRTCDVLKQEQSKPIARLCDNIKGIPLTQCVSPGVRDCSVMFPFLSKAVIKSLITLFKNQTTVDALSLDKVFVYQQTVTVVGVDNRNSGKSVKQNVLEMGLLFLSVLMREQQTELTYRDQPIADVLMLYRKIIESSLVERTVVDRSMKLLTSYTSISDDPTKDGVEVKSKLLTASGYGMLMQSITLLKEEDITLVNKLTELLENNYFSKEVVGMLLPSLMPGPDI